MSIFETVTLESESALKTRQIAFSLANSLYGRPLTIFVSGELGAGKTTFAQGLAEGLGIGEPVVSPTYALEQHYGDALTHIDLYRLQADQAAGFLAASEDHPGIRLIEWAERLPEGTQEGPCILIDIRELSKTRRRLRFRLHDVPIPPPSDIRSWITQAALPAHIRKHTTAVARVAGLCADTLLHRGVFIRKKALVAAAHLHDMLRFCDFKSLDGDAFYTPTPKQTAVWKRLKEAYGQPHEQAAQRFLTERGYPGIGLIVRTHGTHGMQDASFKPTSTEQLVLSYSDKRVMFDTVVTLDQRFDDFVTRYSSGEESDFSRSWRAELKRIEKLLFPDGPPL